MLFDGLPLHAMAVHLPLALAALLPFGFVAAWFVGRGGRDVQLLWRILAGLQMILFISGLAAAKLGEQEEERVERVVSERAIHEHEERADGFIWAAGFGVALSLLAAYRDSQSFSSGLRLVTAGSSLVALGFAAAAGHAGAELVYKYNAGSAYVGTNPQSNVDGTKQGEEANEAQEDDFDD